jgi:hypothetical protein
MEDGQGIHIGEINPYQFAQLLAKIAYGFATAEWGYDAESEALRTGFRRKPDSVPMIADSR